MTITTKTIYARPTRLLASHNVAIVKRSGQNPTTIPAAMCALAGDGSATAEWRETDTFVGDPTFNTGPDAVVNYQVADPVGQSYWEVGFHAWAVPPAGTDLWYANPRSGLIRMNWVDWSADANHDFTVRIDLKHDGQVIRSVTITDEDIAANGTAGTLVTLNIPQVFPDGQTFGMGHIGGLTVRATRLNNEFTGDLHDYAIQAMELRLQADTWEAGSDDDEIVKGDDDIMANRVDKQLAWGGIVATPTALEIPMPFGARLLVSHHISGSPSTGGYCSVEIGNVATTQAPATKALASIARSTTTMTVTTAQDHGLRAGDVVTISGSNQAIFNRVFTVATVPTSTTFTATIANTGAASATGGNLVPNSLYVPHHGDGVNIKAGAATASYSSIFKNCGSVARLSCTITDGVHSVWYEVLP